ncbi:MAG TPA: hypothetical protein VMS17_25265, partial [Gemmataceae bacterium]|nr:hypothetical protein [Gemmataceae bacterium]
RATTGRDRILVLVTDGQVGNEDQLLRTLADRLKSIRVFTLGVDQAVNAAFLKRLSDLGGGGSELVESEERLDDVMDRVHRQIGTPVLTDLRMEPAGLRFIPGSVTPSRLPALFAGTPLTILGRYRGPATGGVALQGRDASGGMWSTEVIARREASPVAAVVWARGRLRDLEDRYAVGGGDRAALEKDITDLSLRFGVLCRFTAFVAVDRSEVVNQGGRVHSIVQPVEQPAAWAQPPTLLHCLRAPASAAPAAPKPRAECVDSYLMDMAPASARPAAHRAQISKDGPADSVRAIAPTAKGAGLLQRLLDLFRGKKVQAPPVNRKPYRQRLADALQVIREHPTTDAGSRLDVLRALTPTLEAVFTEWTQAGERDAAVRELGEAALALQAPLTEAKPAEKAVAELWKRTEAAVLACLTLCGGPPAPKPAAREGFWK